MMNKTELD